MQTLTATGFGTRELSMAELDLVSGGWNWNKVDWGKAAALGGVGTLGGGIAGAGGGPVGAGFGAADGFIAGFGGSVINDAWWNYTWAIGGLQDGFAWNKAVLQSRHLNFTLWENHYEKIYVDLRSDIFFIHADIFLFFHLPWNRWSLQIHRYFDADFCTNQFFIKQIF